MIITATHMKNPMTQKHILLPSGFYDLLPPEAEKESGAIRQMLEVFSAFGYQHIAPPLMEFEASLLGGRGEALSEQTFRVMDTKSAQMLAIRSDITLQAARIASTRLKQLPRPLRLCYAGIIVQSKPEPLRNARQLTQAGIELIGSDALNADAEIMIIAANVLTRLGIKDITLDINLPGLLHELCPEAHHDKALQKQVKDAIICKDTTTIAHLPIKHNQLLAELVASAGAYKKTLPILQKLGIAQADDLQKLTQVVAKNCPHIAITLDIIEYRGFEYHNGVSFSLFAGGLRHELGRGGRYKVEGEQATGFTIYVTHLLSLLPALPEKSYKTIALSESSASIQALHEQGYVTLYEL